jgi:hypothetical protein
MSQFSISMMREQVARLHISESVFHATIVSISRLAEVFSFRLAVEVSDSNWRSLMSIFCRRWSPLDDQSLDSWTYVEQYFL